MERQALHLQILKMGASAQQLADGYAAFDRACQSVVTAVAGFSQHLAAHQERCGGPVVFVGDADVGSGGDRAG